MVVHVHMNFILFLHSTNERVEKETQYSKSDEKEDNVTKQYK